MHRPLPLVGALGCLLAAHLALGIAHLALLPPWEGFDEIAHYSYIQQIADTSRLPRPGTAWISTDFLRYAAEAPLPYNHVPPMEANGGITYRAFFAQGAGQGPGAEVAVHRPPAAPRRYAPGSGPNWQAQHPPLYYLALVPLHLATRHLSWGAHLFALRLVSYLFAWTALLVGVSACLTPAARRLTGPGCATWMALGLAVWPVLIPSWYPEMARLGNDSLCALIMAGVWLVCLRGLEGGLSVGRAATLGILLGLGALSKAFFVPVGGGVVAFWVARQWARGGGAPAPSRWAAPAVTVALALAIAGWWYLATWRQHGVPLGALESVLVREAGGLGPLLAQRFSLASWIRGHAAVLTTLAWSGTQSLVRPPYPPLALLAGIVLCLAGLYGSTLRRSAPLGPWWLPAWIVTPVLLGLSYHVLLRIALSGEGAGTSGYYLHFLVVPLGAAVGLGLGRWWLRPRLRATVALATAYALLFAVVISWAQVLLFAGVLFKAGASRFYQSPGALPPWLGLPDALERLGALALPRLGAPAWLLGGLLVVVGLVLAWRAAGRQPVCDEDLMRSSPV